MIKTLLKGLFILVFYPRISIMELSRIFDNVVELSNNNQFKKCNNEDRGLY